MSKLPQPQFEPLKIGKLLHFGVRDKLMIVSLLAVTLALVVSGWLLLERQRAHVFTDVLTRTPQLARVVGIGLTSSVLGFDYHAIQQILDETVAADGIVYARVENAKGITMAEAGVRPVSQQDSVVAHHLEALDAWDERIAAIYRDLGAVALDLARAQGEGDKAALARIEAGLTVPDIWLRGARAVDSTRDPRDRYVGADVQGVYYEGDRNIAV